MKPARISFYGNFGAGNLGNEATLEAVIQQILRRFPDAQLLCFCANPQDVRTRHNIAAFPSEAVDRSAAARSRSSARRGKLTRFFRIVFRRIPLELVHWIKCLQALARTDMLIIAGTGIVATTDRAAGLALRYIQTIDACGAVSGQTRVPQRWGWAYPPSAQPLASEEEPCAGSPPKLPRRGIEAISAADRVQHRSRFRLPGCGLWPLEGKPGLWG